MHPWTDSPWCILGLTRLGASALHQVVKHSQELKRVQRQLAGVTGSKDDEIERLETRVATLEVTIKSRNAEVRTRLFETGGLRDYGCGARRG